MTAAAVIDWEYLGSFRELQMPGEPDIVTILVQTFSCESTAGLARLVHAVHLRDPAAIRRAAHGLRGGAGQIGAIELAHAAAQLEVRHDVGGGELLCLLDRIQTALRDALTALTAGTLEHPSSTPGVSGPR
jgi:HPt (histidine-containing phosphotransfer) domain-containing protein